MLRTGFADELLARLARSAARRASLRNAASGALGGATLTSLVVLLLTRRRAR